MGISISRKQAPGFGLRASGAVGYRLRATGFGGCGLQAPASGPQRWAPVAEVREKVEPEIETVVLAPETISLEEVEEAGEDVAVEDEEIVDLGEDEAEIPAAGDDDTFLEEPEGDEEADVSGIVSGPEQGEEG